MSEYWVSHKKYFCKYCNIYIADDAPSRSQHEGGLRHKGNVERFVRGLYKAGEKRKQDLDEEKREMARVEQAAQAAFARDVGAGLVKPGSSSASAPPKPSTPRPPPKRSSNPYEDYTTAASLGYTDPDAERAKAEAERRRTQGVAGEWQVVAAEEPAQEGQPVPLAEGSRKREAESVPDEDDERHYKLRKKKLDSGLGEIYDPGLVPIKLKVKKEEPVEAGPSSGPSTSTGDVNASTVPLPKWTTRGWSKPSETSVTPSSAVGDIPGPTPRDVSPLQTETPSTIPASLQEQSSKSEPPQETLVESKLKTEDDSVKVEEGVVAPSGGMFRKRKIPGGARGRR